MDEHEENFKDIFRYTDVEYTPDGYTDVYRWDDFLVIAGDHVYSAMDTIDSVSPGGEYEGFDPQYAYTCEIVGCGDLFDGCALFRPVSHDGEDYIQIAFLRSDIDDSTGEYTERFEAGSFDMPAADALRFDLAVDLMDYFSGRTFEGEPGVSRGLEPREAVAAVEGATGCDLNFFEDFWLGSPGEIVESVHVGPYTKQSLLDFSYYAKELSRRYGFADSDILEIARHLPEECPDRFAAVKAYLDCEYVPDGDAPDEKTYRWGDFLEIAGGDARYAAMLVDRTAAGEPEEDAVKIIATEHVVAHRASHLGMLRIVGHAAVLIFQAALLTCLLSFRLLVIPDKHRDDSLNAPKNSSEHYERHEGFYHCVHLGFLFLLCG